jgi:hypothetical protein
MWWVTPPVVADMSQYISTDDRVPRLVVAVAAAVAAVYAPNVWLRGLLAAIAATMSATVVFGSAPTNGTESREAPHWRTLKTYRVEV